MLNKAQKGRSANLMHHAGYTIDQTILIVAIIAILITIVIATVGWDLISRTGGAKLAAQFRQIEDANGQFFAQHMRWPHQATGASLTGADPLRVLTAESTMIAQATFRNLICGGAVCSDQVKNLLPGIRWSGTTALHNFGSGNALEIITMRAAVPPAATGLGGNTYLLVGFHRVSRAEVIEADKKIDGTESATAGRLFYRVTGADACTSGGAAVAATAQELNVCYAANVIQ